MKKLKLNLEELKVDSFETESSNLDKKGTAKGYTSLVAPPCLTLGGDTCDQRTCRDTCYTCSCICTEYQSCLPTCDETPHICGPDPVTVD